MFRRYAKPGVKAGVNQRWIIVFAMAYEPGAIDGALAAALGDDSALMAELHAAFVESVERAAATLRHSGDAVGWRHAAMRLKGLAASFGAARLMALAAEAAELPPGDRAMLDRIDHAITRL